MTATTTAGADGIARRYYLAMATPFAIDFVASAVYAAVNAHPLVLLSMAVASSAFLLLGAGMGALLLIRPIERFLAGRAAFAEIEPALAGLPRRSALLIGGLYAPMLALRLLSPRLGVSFGAGIEPAAWLDTICTLAVGTSFNIVLTYFVVSAYLERLCEQLFVLRGVNIATFQAIFRRKVGIAVLFVSFASMTLLAGDIASYSGDRLAREAAVDVAVSVMGGVATYYWIWRALTGPIGRLDQGMRRVSEGDLTVRLPVTSNDEVGRATSGFNRMVEGLAESRFLRDAFGKYVSEAVAQQILGDRTQGGRLGNTLAEATLMFVDIEGFTGLSERLSPADTASVLNTYLAVVLPAIERHGGVVNNFSGDGIFGSFNLPLARPDHAASALRAALEIQKELAAATFAAGATVRARIGINTGPVVGVSIGTEQRLDYTLLGDAVNVASRVEQLNKQFGTHILATESTVRAAGAGFASVRLGETGVRGHRGDVVVYRLDPA